MHGAKEAEHVGTNPSGARRMAVIAFLSFNLSMGCVYGPFGVMITPIEQRLGVTREISTLAVPVVTFVLSFLAPFVGGLASRVSLRLLMMAGSLLMAAGFALLAVADTVPLFIGAYGLLIGPGLCVCGLVAPSTLITRWFKVDRGRALGIATTPAIMAATPLLITFMLNRFGLAQSFWLLALLMLACVVASAFAIDHPPHAEPLAAGSPGSEGMAASEAPAPSIFGNNRFWRLAIAAGLYNAVIVMFSTQIVPFATGLGIEPTSAALLLTAYLVGTLVGTPLVGWAADKVGGVRMIAVLSITLALWQGLLILQPSYAVIAVLAGLAGLQGTAMISCLGLALSEQLGQAAFAKAWGASALVGLPFAVLSVPVTSAIFVRTGTYVLAFVIAATLLVIASALAISIRRSAGQANVAAA